MIEYALIASLIALAVVAGMAQLGGGVGDSWRAVDQAVGNVLGPFPTGNSVGNGNGNAGNAGGNGNSNGGANGNGGGNGNSDAGGNGNGNGGGNGND